MGLALRDVTYTYAGATVPALSAVSATFEPGRVYGVVGQTGAGKTTLCNLLTGFAPHFLKGSLVGDVLLDGTRTTEIGLEELVTRVGYVFQNPFEQLSHITYSVEEEVGFGLQNLGVPAAQIRRRVSEAMGLLGIEPLRERFPLHLSGGQLQRVAVASILAMSPAIVVLDEPTSQLDPEGTGEVFSAVGAMRSAGLTVILVEHKVELLATYADEIVVLEGARLVRRGPPIRIFSDPACTSWGVERPQLAELALRLGHVGGADHLPFSVDEFLELVPLERVP